METVIDYAQIKKVGYLAYIKSLPEAVRQELWDEEETEDENNWREEQAIKENHHD